jgi:hypothetical protein
MGDSDGNLPSKKNTVLSVAGIASVTVLFTLLDFRYALSSDLSVLTEAIQTDRVERIETEIKLAEGSILYILAKALEDRTAWEKQLLILEQNRKEMAVRKLLRITTEQKR